MENYENFNNSESIFDDKSPEYSSDKMVNDLTSDAKYKSHLSNNFIYNIIDSISDKLEEFAKKNKTDREIKALKKFAENKLAGREAVLKLFKAFDCHLTVMDKCVEFSCKQLNMTGKITFDKNQKAIFDETTINIFRTIAEIISNSNSLEDVIDKYEEQGFYPIGNLEKQTVTVDGKPKEVMVGTLQNQQGEQKKIYYSEGKEIFIDE